jgi:GAF domain-containing protein
MRRRSRASSKVAKARSRKAKTPKAVRHSSPSVDRQETEVARLTRELHEAQEQQTATAEVLKIISTSPTELQPVLEVVARSAARFCEADDVTIFELDGQYLHTAAHWGTVPQEIGVRFPCVRGQVTGRAVLERKPVHVIDLQAEADEFPEGSAFARRFGHRTIAAAPLLREGVAVGSIVLRRAEVNPFTNKQITLLETFAAQAVIAIENTRLLNELRQSLQQQTATADVLKTISRSTFDLPTVLDTLAQSAALLCRADRSGIRLAKDGLYYNVASHGYSPEHKARMEREPFKVDRTSVVGRVVLDAKSVHLVDSQADPNPELVNRSRSGNIRTLLGVPLQREGIPIGVLLLQRSIVQPFTDKEIALAETFADQAVIAIENVRLFEAEQRRTRELTESLEQQTATSEVLKVISSSPGELEPVFQTMLQNATRLCDAKFGSLFEFADGAFRALSNLNTPPALVDFNRELRVWGPHTALGRLAHTRQTVHVGDALSDRAYREDVGRKAAVQLGGIRTLLAVPMLKEDVLVGAITIFRQEVRPFTDKQIALVTNFAAQAVIAIENTRLLNELRESLDRQTATSDVLQVISSSPGNLKSVFDAILENATRICQANFGILNFYEGGGLRMGAMHNVPSAFADWHQAHRGLYQPIPGSPPDRVIKTKKVCHVVDNASEASPGRAATLGGARSTVCVPILKDDMLIGTITIFRQEVRPFTDKQIALLASFANQAVIAIENARLLDDLNKMNQQLEQRVTDQVEEIERMSRLRRFLPPQVADLIVASGTEKQLESHRREITALFCDLRGFTGFSESSDPEDVMALLAEYHAAIGTIIKKYSGTLERYAGDGVMVIFNDPVPVENPALQAVLMALDMRAAIGGLIEKWRDLGHDLGFGIGIAHGFATLGTIGFEGRRDYAAIGTVSNVASRLCDEAKPGQILISPRVRQAVEKAVAVESVGEFALKGIRRPMQAYNVLESKPN